MACLNAAVVIGESALDGSAEASMRALAAFVAEEPASRRGFAPLNPTIEPGVDQVDLARDLGLSGVAISPADDGYRPTHDDCLAVLERCAALGLPVLVVNPRLATPESSLEFARPSLLDEVLQQTDGLTLVVGDLGGPWHDEAFALVAKHERAFAEISGLVRRTWGLYAGLMSAFERGVTDKLLFASGYPLESPQSAIERIYTINGIRGGSSLPTIPRESLRSIVERDAFACLGIAAAPPMRSERDAGELPPAMTTGAARSRADRTAQR